MVSFVSRVLGRRPPREGVDRNLGNRFGTDVECGRPPREGVDRNVECQKRLREWAGRPPREGVDRNGDMPGLTNNVEVALRARAWIETTHREHAVDPFVGSPSARGRGSKHRGAAPARKIRRRPPREGVDRNAARGYSHRSGRVALRARAWIETMLRAAGALAAVVALRARAWIETRLPRHHDDGLRRRPPREGVDRNREGDRHMRRVGKSPSARGRGSKRPIHAVRRPLYGSPSARGRGSKRDKSKQHRARHCRPPREGVDRNVTAAVGTVLVKLSPSARGRGSKRITAIGDEKMLAVALRARAWIETSMPDRSREHFESRPPREGVDRNRSLRIPASSTSRRPPREGVDRNVKVTRQALSDVVALRARAWIETPSIEYVRETGLSPSARGRGSKPLARHGPDRAAAVALRARAWIETILADGYTQPVGRPPREGVDRNEVSIVSFPANRRRPPREGVDRN